MKQVIHYTHCPVCGSSRLHEVLRAKDHTVSGETFPIAECSDCTLRFTQDVPDAASIAPYYQSDNYISHSDTEKGIVNRIYHLVRKATLTRKRKLVQQTTGLATGKLLEVGSGTGAFLREMKSQGWETTGLEPDAGARQIAKELHGLTLQETGLLYSLPPGSFDAITLWHVLEHVHDLSQYIEQLKMVLKPAGRLIVAVPNYTAADEKFYKEFWAAYDVPRHLYHFSPRSVQVLMERHGLKILAHRPMWFDSFYIAMLSSRYRTGRTSWLASFWNGLRSNGKALGDATRCSSVIYIIGK
ncbi:MAG: class I SAM-dependent methyltransferase [Chitinophagaceae bacterium]